MLIRVGYELIHERPQSTPMVRCFECPLLAGARYRRSRFDYHRSVRARHCLSRWLREFVLEDRGSPGRIGLPAPASFGILASPMRSPPQPLNTSSRICRMRPWFFSWAAAIATRIVCPSGRDLFGHYASRLGTGSSDMRFRPSPHYLRL